MPNFSSLARLEVPEKFLWCGVGFAKSFSCSMFNPTSVLRLCCVVEGVVTIFSMFQNDVGIELSI